MAWPGSSANGDPRGRSEERPDSPACPLACRRTSAKRTRFAHLSFDAHDPERKLPSSDWLIILRSFWSPGVDYIEHVALAYWR